MLKVPFIIGGDFNYSHEKVRKAIHNDKQLQQIVQIYYNMPQLLRTVGLKDFFIASKTLTLGEVATIKWKKCVEDIFTHDSVVATLMKSASEPSANLQ